MCKAGSASTVNCYYHHITRLLKSTLTISTDAEKASDKIQRPFMIKILKKLGTQGNTIIRINIIYKKLELTNIIFKVTNPKLSH